MPVMRLIDILISLISLILLSPIIFIIMIICFWNTGRAFFYQKRVGRYKEPFTLIKFPTMKIGTPSVATHLVNPNNVTPFGQFLRRYKLDEFPQLLNVIKGDMSLVGPRPCLFNQFELIQERSKRGIFDVRPGITGLAQIKGVDMSKPELLAKIEEEMIKKLTAKEYFLYIILTALGKGTGDRIKFNGN